MVLGKELPGFVANRLQTIIAKEAQWLVQQGVADVAQLDTVLQNSLGLRWATIRLFEGNVLGGGPGLARHLYAGVGAETGKIEFFEPDPAKVPAGDRADRSDLRLRPGRVRRIVQEARRVHGRCPECPRRM